ncbi:SIMPL domain-containing protein [Gemmobacter fulvus]|uniref:SIMPL domain-containing protein n=1 Tax=Gemmobacter fulvus TaxID=2840474 RepID=A0A975P810_9RHOB|nr:SIMPL domain-containing protein [Gemmobacter fulvus]MBT9244380.1 SIMPL domain-containing protein [Gemmobacter fulvus]QWK91260.1 SIMPL domain-containing protein [Gemmobacter fulvus]
MRLWNVLVMTTALGLAGAGMAVAADPAPQITVTGEGQVNGAPDLATISLGVTTEGATAAEAMAANSAELARVMGNLTMAGIAAKDVQTTGLSINPNWQNDSSGATAPRIAGYIASNMLTVRVRALEGLGSVLDAAVKDGANTLNGVEFGLADPAPAMDEARKRAVADARGRATLLAEAAGVTLGKIVSISESGGYQPPMPMMRMAADAAGGAVPVAAGEVSVSANVTIVWALGE